MKLKRVKAGILAFSFIGLMAVAAPLTNAQTWYGQDRYEQDRYEREQRRRQRQMEREQRRDQRRDQRRWNSTYGYNSSGYNRYNDGYPDLGGTYNFRQTALNAGANEGIKEGRKDRSRGERFDFTDESAFQSATKDYNSRLGDRETYRAYFRMAFESAYKDGYAGY